MSGVIKEEEYKNMMCLKDALLCHIYMNPDSLMEIQPDYKHQGVCHIKHKSGKWFHLRQSVLEVQKIYCDSKRKLALEKKAKGG